MKRFLLLALSLFVLAVTAGVGTFAYLQDAEESLANSFAAGTLDLKLRSGEGPAAETVKLHPDYGRDTSKSANCTFPGAGLSHMAADDNQRYETGGWPGGYGGEYLELGFPDIPDGVAVDGAVLKFAWQRRPPVEAARLQVCCGDELRGTRDLSLPPPNTDELVTLDLRNEYGIDTPEEVNDLKIRFQAHCGGHPGGNTAHNLAEVAVRYTPPGGPEWTDGLNEPLVVEDVRPGDASSAPLVIGVKNTGTIGGRLLTSVTHVVSEEAYSPGWETGDTGEPGELGQYLQLTVSFGGQNTVTCGLGELADPVLLGELGPGEENTVSVSWFVPKSTGSEVYNDRVRFNVEFILEQS